MDTFGKIVAAILLVFMIFIHPLQYLFESQESVKFSFVEAHGKEFVDHVCSTGEITREQYEQLKADLSNTGNRYKIDMEHTHAVTGMDVSEEKIEDSKSPRVVSTLATLTAEQSYRESIETSSITSNIASNAIINTASNATSNATINAASNATSNATSNVISNIASDTISNATSNITSNIASNAIINTTSHVHTDACYYGTKHVHSGDRFSGTGCYAGGTVHRGGEICYSVEYENGSLQTYVDGSSSCGSCGSTLTFYLYYGSCKTCGKTGLIYSNYWCSRTWCSRYNPGYSVETLFEKIRTGSFGLQENHRTPTYYDLNCGKSVDSYYDTNGNPSNPLCGSIVTGISPNVTTQTIKAGESINTSATVSFRNGSTAQVNCSTNFNNTIVGNNRTATLTYYGYANSSNAANNVKTAFTCTVTVNVKSAKKLSSIQANLSKTTIERYDNFPITSLKLTYDNGETEVVTSGWSIVGFNNRTGGSQNVTVSYTKDGTTCNTTATIFVRQLASITANMNATTISKYSAFPITSLTLTYNNGSTELVTSGWTVTGFVNNFRGTYTVKVGYTRSDITCYTNVVIQVENLLTMCQYCENNYYLNDYDFDEGCPYCKNEIDHLEVNKEFVTLKKGTNLDIIVTVVYKDGHKAKVTNWTSNFNPNKIGGQVVTISYGGHSKQLNVVVLGSKTCSICGNDYDLSLDGSDPGCPICSEQVKSITASPTSTTVEYGKQLNITVTATYMDGHSKVVQDYTSNFDKYQVGVQKVTIYYKEKNTAITVEVIKKESIVTCPTCNQPYDAELYPSGCPKCKVEFVSISASLVNGGTKVQLGSDLILRVIVQYRDNHREMKYSGYTVENYDKHKLGEQTVTVTYQGFRCQLMIEVVNQLIKVTCPNGHVYSLNEDGSDPGCPYCSDSTSVSGIAYLDVVYTSEILEILYGTGVYEIPEGDYFTIVITKEKFTSQVKNSFFMHYNFLGTNKKFTYGGEVA